LTLVDYFTMHNSLAESDIDQDLGSGGGMLLPDLTDSSGQVHHLMVGAGKDTNIYVLDRDNLGKFNADSDSQIWQKLANAFPSTAENPGGVYGGPAYFNNTVYFAAVSDVLRAFPIANARLSSAATSTSGNNFIYPGATPSVSANGSQNGIVWAVVNSSSHAVLKAYAASDLGVQLYSSDQSGSADAIGPGSKNTPPTIADGKVFVGTQVNSATDPNGAQNGVAVFGLRPPAPPSLL
jgi:outer membrane protein assembly factor BamB